MFLRVEVLDSIAGFSNSLLLVTISKAPVTTSDALVTSRNKKPKLKQTNYSLADAAVAYR